MCNCCFVIFPDHFVGTKLLLYPPFSSAPSSPALEFSRNSALRSMETEDRLSVRLWLFQTALFVSCQCPNHLISGTFQYFWQYFLICQYWLCHTLYSGESRNSKTDLGFSIDCKTKPVIDSHCKFESRTVGWYSVPVK